MKKSKRFLCVLVAIAVMVSVFIVPGSATDFVSEMAPIFSGALPDQSAALAANELLWKTFTLDEAGMPIAYPEEYGGAFIDGELLYIYIVDLDDSLEAKYLEICKNSPAVRFLEADYSANYLNSLFEVVRECKDKYDITGYGIDFVNNRFCIEINDAVSAGDEVMYDNSCKSYHRQCAELTAELSNPAITIKSGDYLQTTSTALIGGSEVSGHASNGLDINSFTLGFCGTYNGAPAFLTAGHNVGATDGSGTQRIYSVSYNETTIGTVGSNDFQYSHNESGDWAIVTITNPDIAITNDVYLGNTTNSINITAVSTTYAAGQFVHMYGFVSGYRTGVLESYAYEFTDTTRGVTLTNMCKVDAGSASNLTVRGDSGGPVYASVANGYSALGTITGYKTTPSEYITVFSPIGYALNAGFVPRTW